MMELQLITSMYPEEISFYEPLIEDILAASDLGEALKEKGPFLVDLMPTEFVFMPDSGRLELNFKLPSNYPKSGDRLEAHIRLLDTNIFSATLKRLQTQANSRLREYLVDNEEANILSVIQWLSDYEEKLAVDVQAAVEQANQEKKGALRLTLIPLSKTKRAIEKHRLAITY